MPVSQSPFEHLPLPPDAAGRRLDAWLAEAWPERSRAEWKRLIDAGLVRANGRPAPRSLVLTASMRVELAPELASDAPAAPAIVPDLAAARLLRVVWRDADLLVLDKPAGLPCHPLKPGEAGTVINGAAVLAPESAVAGPKPLEGGLVHRLDTQTSGLLAIALNPPAWEALQAAFRAHRARKYYLAIVEGDLAEDTIIDWPIAHHARDARRMVALQPGDETHGQPAWRGRPRPARSVVRVLQRLDGITLVEVTVVQAQMHQIRVHLAAAGHPLVADAVYGRCPHRGLDRHALHAWRLELPHPVHGGMLSLAAPLPADLAQLLRSAGGVPPAD
jgi:23S rRNA pseudouridine1911/1915/1917 synthase